VKLSEGPTVEVSAEVDAPASAVWGYVSDLDLPARFSSEYQGGVWLDPPALDARFEGTNFHEAIGEWRIVSWLSAYEPERRFGWVTSDPDNPGAQWLYEIEPLDEGRCRLRHRVRLGPGPSGLTPAIERMPEKEDRIIERRLEEHRANMQAVVDGIKQLAESA
jgi:hypothetical protein